MTPGLESGILLLTGPPCSGKTSVGRSLAAESLSIQRICVEVDAVFSMLLPESDRNRHDRMLAYEAAHLVARVAFERGLSPILECTYSRFEQRASLVKALAEIPEARLWVVEIAISPHDAVRRFRERQQATDLDENLVRERAESFPYSEHALHLVSSPASPPGDLAHQITTWLQHRPRSIDRNKWAEAGLAWN